MMIHDRSIPVANLACVRRHKSSPHRRDGFIHITTLIEVVLIGIVLWGVVSTIPILLHSAGATSSDRSAKHAASIFRLATIQDGQQLWIQRGLGEILTVDLATGKTRTVYRKNDLPIYNSVVSRDGATCLLSLDDREILIFREHQLIASERSHEVTTINTDLSSSGQTAVVIRKGTEVQIWDLSSADPTSSNFQLSDPADRIALNSKGSMLVVSTPQGHLNLYDVKTGHLTKTLSAGEALSGPPVFSEDGHWLAVVRGQTLTLYDVDSGEIAWTIRGDRPDRYQAVTISADGRRIAAAGLGTGVQVIDSSNGNLIHQFLPGSAIYRLAFSPSSDTLYTGGINGEIRVWSLSTGLELEPVNLFEQKSANNY